MEDKRINNAWTTNLRPCGRELARGDHGCTRPGAARDLGQREQRARQSTRRPSWSGLEPPALTLSLGLARGPRSPPDDDEGARIRTTSRTVGASRGSTKACGCRHAPKKGTHKAPEPPPYPRRRHEDPQEYSGSHQAP